MLQDQANAADSESRAEQAVRAGYAALLAGDGLKANPYSMAAQRVECVAWGRGWAAARTDLKRANAKLA